ncbi:MAG: Fic family protein [Opitutales bacterium]
MATPAENLAKSLEALKKLQSQSEGIAIRSRDLSRTDRERLTDNGFLKEAMKGWYYPTSPNERLGESTAWYAAFWPFCAAYLEERFGADWSLSPEQSLLLHAGNLTVPPQLLVRAKKAGKKIIQLPHKTSLLDVAAALPPEGHADTLEGLRVFSLEAALIFCSPGFFAQHAIDAKAVLGKIQDSSALLAMLLEEGRSRIAGRLVGALRHIGRERIADDMLKTMESVGYTVNVSNPFEDEQTILSRTVSEPAHVTRLRIMWDSMRDPVIANFPEAPGLPQDVQSYLESVNEIYANDAYNSLSIEGYRVTPDLIERVKSGRWNPDQDRSDFEQRDALAARGYWQAFQGVKKSVEAILKGGLAGEVVDQDHGDWYRELFAPSVTAGIIRPSDLAGYRSNPVYIRQSMHVPMNFSAVRDAMPVFFELLSKEENAAVRVVLGHFVFVYIHPYPDGNGRIGRFLMNTMLASGGYDWLVVPLEQRERYMRSLETASVQQNIVPFTQLLAELLDMQ